MVARRIVLVGVPALFLFGAVVLLVSSSRGGRRTSRPEGEAVRGPPPSQAARTLARETTQDRHPDLDLAGLVLNDDNVGIPGARVRTIRNPRVSGIRPLGLSRLVTRARVSGPATITDAQGRFRIRLRRAENVALEVSAEGFAPAFVHTVLAGSRIVVRLPSARTLTVVVIDDQGSPAPGTALEVTGRSRSNGRGWRGVYRGESDAGGKMPIACPLTGSIHVRATHPNLGFVATILPISEEVDACTVRLRPWRPVRGRVLAHESGGPIAGARVRVCGNVPHDTTTGADGGFALGIPDHRARIVLEADAPHRVCQALVAKDGMEFQLRRGHTVVGRIVHHDSRPAAEALVEAVGTRRTILREAAHESRADLTDGHGAFRLKGLDSRLPHTLIVVAEGSGSLLVDFDAAGSPSALVDLGEIRLPPPSRIEGKVVDSSGLPVTGLTVHLHGANDDRAARRSPPRPAQTDFGSHRVQRNDDRGRFGFSGLSPGSYRVSVAPHGQASTVARVAVRPGEDVRGIRLRLPHSHALRVQVVDTSRSPVPRVSVQVLDENARVHAALTSDAGEAVLRLPSKLHGREVRMLATPTARHGEVLPTLARIPARASRADITLNRAFIRRGRLADMDGAPISGGILVVESGGTWVGRTTTDENGEFGLTLAESLPNRIVLRALRNDSDSRKARQELLPSPPEWAGIRASAEPLELEADLDAARTLAGRSR